MKNILLAIAFCQIIVSTCCNTQNKEPTNKTDSVGKIEIYDKSAADLIDTNATIEILGRH